jgi:hypothetical protein
MDNEPAALRLVKHLVAAIPLLALPFAPLVGRSGADFLIYALLGHAALQ